MSEDRRSVWILGDQLLAQHPALEAAASEVDRESICVVLVESRRCTGRLPYHRKKLTLLFSALRHYAQRLKQMDYQVENLKASTFTEGLRCHLTNWKPRVLYTMAASEYGGRRFQETGSSQALGLPVKVVPKTQFLTGRFNPYPDPDPGKRYVLERFYRAMRTHFGLLLDQAGQPLGGQWNYDYINREPIPGWNGSPTYLYPINLQQRVGEALPATLLSIEKRPPMLFSPLSGLGSRIHTPEQRDSR